MKRIESNERMSQAVISGNTIYLSGQTAIDMKLDIKGQTQQTLSEIERYLTAAGSDKTHILSATIYLKDIDQDFSAMNEIWDQWLPSGKTPARATVQAQMCHPDYLIEISIIAQVI